MVALMRDSLRELHGAAESAHAGLLIQRGLVAHNDNDSEAKTKHIESVCGRTVSDEFYGNAYRRWKAATEDAQRFRQVTLALESRLFIGMAGGGALETGCAISHSHGMPYIPGSSVKGVVSHHARGHLTGKEGRAARRELFGAAGSAEHPAGLVGLIGFHDAWWVPRSADRPLVQEVVTTHHRDYYSADGKQPATDFDSPVPNAQIAVQGSFLFVMEGPCAWLGLAEEILKDALHARGIGAKTRAGYGFFKRDAVREARATCAWVDNKIEEISKATSTANHGVALRGRQLANAWDALEDSDLKREAFEDIRARWQDNGWWDTPPSKKAAAAAKSIYVKYADDSCDGQASQ